MQPNSRLNWPILKSLPSCPGLRSHNPHYTAIVARLFALIRTFKVVFVALLIRKIIKSVLDRGVIMTEGL